MLSRRRRWRRGGWPSWSYRRRGATGRRRRRTRLGRRQTLASSTPHNRITASLHITRHRQTRVTRCLMSIVLYANVDTQCDKLASDDRCQFITLSVHLKPSPDQQQCRSNIIEATSNFVTFSPVHISNTIDATLSNAKCWTIHSTKSNVAST